MNFNNQNKKDYIYKMFNSIACDYDKMNKIITFGTHMFIKKQAIKNVQIKPDAKVLDVCCGTGDISIFIAKNLIKTGKVTGVDFSENMLDIAGKRAKSFSNIEFMQADALNLPFEDEAFDVCFISFGLRNLEDIEKGILELKRVTKKGGFVVNLDLGKPKGILNFFFRLYFFNLVPFFGQLFHGNFQPYKYLPESSREFPSQDELVSIFYNLGFSTVKNYNFAFCSIAQQIAQK